MTKTLGLIAGNGHFPLEVANEAREQGFSVFSCAIKDEADPSIEKLSERLVWVKLGELGKVIQFFKKQGVSSAVLAGKVTKTSLFKGHIRPDLEMIKALASIRDWKDDSLLLSIVNHLNKKGIQILDSTSFLKNGMLPAGVLTKRQPTKAEWEDIEFGWQLAKEMGRLDVGQTIVVKNKAVMAVEAIEGTDEAVRRGGKLANGGAVVVKVAKPKQDMRFDVPAVGVNTLRSLHEAGAAVLALEAGKTILLEKEAFVEFADKHKISVVLK